MAPRLNRRLLLNLLIFSTVMLVGTIGFTQVEGFSWLESIYFTIATVATVGYGDLSPVTSAGRVLAIMLIITGVGSFLGVIASSAELVLNRRENRLRLNKLQMLVGLFYSEIGSRLLRYFADSDPLGEKEREVLMIDDGWNAQNFRGARLKVTELPFGVRLEQLELESLRDFLDQRSDLLARLLESPFLLEHGSFSDLLLACLHLKEELLARSSLEGLPESDSRHLSGDINRVYLQLIDHWLSYTEHLKEEYPFLYSLAVRTNPFQRDASPTVY